MTKTIRALALTGVLLASNQVLASELDDNIRTCSSLAGITQNALQEMESSNIPLEKTRIFQEVGHDPNIARSLRDAVNIRRQGVSINEITDAWAQGCMNALTGTAAPIPRRGSRIK